MRGIGPAMAKRIVAAFGENTFEIFEVEPDRLKEVAGIGPMRAARIVAGWAEQKAVREIMLFLHGVGTARAVCIFKTYVLSEAGRVPEGAALLNIGVQ
jgi:exodeoxyribonuclease V alpha subunit